MAGVTPGAERPGCRRRVLADPFVLPRLFVALLVAVRVVDRAEFPHDLFTVGTQPSRYLVRADVDPPPVTCSPDPAWCPGVVERELLGREILGMADVDHRVRLGL